MGGGREVARAPQETTLHPNILDTFTLPKCTLCFYLQNLRIYFADCTQMLRKRDEKRVTTLPQRRSSKRP